MLTQLQVGDFLKTLHNPRYINPDHTGAILLDGTVNGYKLEFIASPTDPMEYGRNTYKQAIEGHYGPIGEYIPPQREAPLTAIVDEKTHKKQDLFAGDK